MKQVFVVFLLVAGLAATAQVKTKKPVRKPAKSDSAKIEKAPQAVEEEVPVMKMLEDTKVGTIQQEAVKEELVSVVESVSSGTSRTFNDGDGSYYLYETYSDKGVSVVYKGEGYGNRRYAIIETGTRKKLTPFIFESFSASFSGTHNTANVVVNGKSGIVNSKGEVVLPCIYDALNSFTIDEQTFYIATVRNRTGIITENNEEIFPFEYTRLEKSYYGKNLFIAQKGEMYGMINVVSKEVVLPFEYSRISAEREYLKVSKNNQYTLLGLNGKPLVKDWYTYLNMYDEYAIAELNGRYGIIDLTGKILLPFDYEKLERISNSQDNVNYFLGRKNGKYGMLNLAGNVVIPFEYDDLSKGYYSPLLTATQKNLKGLIDMSGKIVLPLEYSTITASEKSFLLKKGDKYGIMSRDLNMVLPVKCDYIKSISVDNSYRNSYYLVKQNGKVGVCNSSGDLLLDIAYDDLMPASTNRYSESDTYKTPFVAIKKGKYGMVDLKSDPSSESKVIIPFEYEDLDYLNTFLVIAKKSGKYGIRTIYDNVVVLPFEYTSISNKEGNIVGYKNGFVQFRSYGKNVQPVDSAK